MVGNYIDFGALENVNEGELKVQLDEAVNITIDSKLLDVFKNDLVIHFFCNLRCRNPSLFSTISFTLCWYSFISSSVALSGYLSIFRFI